MVLILVLEAAEFPKLFCDLTPKVSNSMLRGTIWENYSLQRIYNKLRESLQLHRLTLGHGMAPVRLC